MSSLLRSRHSEFGSCKGNLYLQPFVKGPQQAPQFRTHSGEFLRRKGMIVRRLEEGDEEACAQMDGEAFCHEPASDAPDRLVQTLQRARSESADLLFGLFSQFPNEEVLQGVVMGLRTACEPLVWDHMPSHELDGGTLQLYCVRLSRCKASMGIACLVKCYLEVIAASSTISRVSVCCKASQLGSFLECGMAVTRHCNELDHLPDGPWLELSMCLDELRTQPFVIVDCFPPQAKPFTGNPICCIFTQQGGDANWMQGAANELGCNETCFIQPSRDPRITSQELAGTGQCHYDLRSFTPHCEVDCGHALLGAAKALWISQRAPDDCVIVFHTRSGELSARVCGSQPAVFRKARLPIIANHSSELGQIGLPVASSMDGAMSEASEPSTPISPGLPLSQTWDERSDRSSSSPGSAYMGGVHATVRDRAEWIELDFPLIQAVPVDIHGADIPSSVANMKRTKPAGGDDDEGQDSDETGDLGMWRQATTSVKSTSGEGLNGISGTPPPRLPSRSFSMLGRSPGARLPIPLAGGPSTPRVDSTLDVLDHNERAAVSHRRELLMAPSLVEALGVDADEVVFIGRTDSDMLIEVTDPAVLQRLRPEYHRVAACCRRGVIITCRATPNDPIVNELKKRFSTRIDFLSRFFAPRIGIPEDPVTAGIYNCLGPYWASSLDRFDLIAYQLSHRGGIVAISVDLRSSRVKLYGQAVSSVEGKLTKKAVPMNNPEDLSLSVMRIFAS